MIKSVHLQNFFGFQDCTINLEKGENVLVGINGSGKSNFFKAIKLLKETADGKGVETTVFEDFLGIEKMMFSQPVRDSYSVTLVYELDAYDMFEISDFGLFYQETFIISRDKKKYYLIEKIWKVETTGRHDFVLRNSDSVYFSEGKEMLIQNRSLKSTESCIPYYREANPGIRELAEIAQNIRVYDSFDLNAIKIGSPYRNELFLLSDGRNLGPLLHQFSLNQKSILDLVTSALKKVNPNFIGVNFESTPSSLHLFLSESHLESATHTIHVSDGTLRFLCLLAIFYNPDRGVIICIDEPELGLHPDMIRTLAEAIEYAAETSQIIISTHSPELLNHFNVENIRVFEKDKNNATIVNQYETEQFDNFMNKYMPGQLWRQGHLGGNRW